MLAVISGYPAAAAGRRLPPGVLRFQIQGPAHWNAPVHETLTQEALRGSGLGGPQVRYSDRAAWQYARGAIWNDDPGGLLFARRPHDNQRYSIPGGLAWYAQFLAAGRAARRRARQQQPGFGPPDSLLARSHYGDLQFLHAMAARDCEPAPATAAQMLLWAEFTYKAATGEIAAGTRLGALPLAGIRALFPRQAQRTVSELFGIRPGDTVGSGAQRAAGSLLHMIQDSYAGGHTAREDRGNHRRGRIIAFHCYTHQDPARHARHDAWGPGDTDAARIRNTLGAQDAVEQGTAILRLVRAGAPWDRARQYIEEHILATVTTPEPAGPGAAYRRTP